MGKTQFVLGVYHSKFGIIYHFDFCNIYDSSPNTYNPDKIEGVVYQIMIKVYGNGYSFLIKKTFSDMYIIAFEQYFIYAVNNKTNLVETAIFKYDSDFKTNSCIGMLKIKF